MVPGRPNTVYPRILRPKEWDLLEFVLPVERAGYKHYRDLAFPMKVIGEGGRGRGNIILGIPGEQPDLLSPLAPVVAYGVVETVRDTFTVTVRECVANQIDVEIVSAKGEEVPDHFEEKGRWTYSAWQPGALSPATRLPVREVAIDDAVVLAVSREERRMWVYDAKNGMNILIPVTSFYNELMLHMGIRDSKVALSSNLLFEGLDTYSDDDLRSAFISYNKMRRKVDVHPSEAGPKEKGLMVFLKKFMRKDR